MAPLSQSSAATRSATGYPTSTRTSGPLPTPARPLSRSRTGPAEMPIHGCGAAAASASASSIIASPSGREDEGIRDEDFAAALRNGEAPGPDLGSDAAHHGAVPQSGLLRVRFRHGAGGIDGPGGHQLSGEVRLAGELRPVTGADLRAVLVHDLADQLRVDGPDHFGLAGAEPDLAVLLAAQAALPVAVVGEPAADAVGPDARDADARPVAAAAAPAVRTTSCRGLISSGSPALTFGGGTPALQNFMPVTIRIAAMLATSTPFQSVCSPPTRATPLTRRMRSARLPLERTAIERCGSGTTRPCASAWLRPRTSSSGPPRTRPSSSSTSCSGLGAATVHPLTSLVRTTARSMPWSSAWHPGADPAWN